MMWGKLQLLVQEVKCLVLVSVLAEDLDGFLEIVSVL